MSQQPSDLPMPGGFKRPEPPYFVVKVEVPAHGLDFIVPLESVKDKSPEQMAVFVEQQVRSEIAKHVTVGHIWSRFVRE